MASKKKNKKEEQEKVKKKFEERELKGKCLKCGKKMGRDFNECSACSRKRRLKSKANRRGKPKDYYLIHKR